MGTDPDGYFSVGKRSVENRVKLHYRSKLNLMIQMSDIWVPSSVVQ